MSLVLSLPPTMSARTIGFLLAFSGFVILQAHAATDNHHATHHPHATHTAKQYAAHQTGHHSSVAHKGKQFLKLVLGIVIGNVFALIMQSPLLTFIRIQQDVLSGHCYFASVVASSSSTERKDRLGMQHK